ncbi:MULTISPECIES: iron-containing redox enzyme family protein [unclassified Herbaspirillum]|uniref:iron-containing redox enzyme family protein n=1 Tax=unclassified Herbaspirillum TaxID=2624150 RepID=UPI000E2EA451|nr:MULTISPECIES: iron-containing redox enzyme family protein [unclassified Herbaspirillum]RFB71227.1 iron-containing redox enzyme family protein [Herbaspirillum sp. 3R-3a1]TFI08236.1 iron-containing redox enzyme family protein [Herbaspirillum sp. 3R11]TFI14651.1 iron-containing redox enzyme family protein [Herbaspirillum sp. 3R-11]TFI31957.1 iron-containing redox enzyme family protein [Herbaspirillum sp. 3C11]TFI31960.1 iron-containing redox enzyme family protein [Herbaspirillum sp. 3C11]
MASTAATSFARARSAQNEPVHTTSAAVLYRALSAPQPSRAAREDGARYLQAQLAQAQDLPCDLPASPDDLQAWVTGRVASVGEQYADYLAARKDGAPRRYFATRSHALNFIRAVAPTKLVDGSWLYGTLPYWEDPDFRPLILTYLEELGDGDPAMNHVTLYKKLLATHDCDDWHNLSDAHFVQGAIQLALGYQTGRFLPEVIGYNLGYEQLPLHLLISAYELNELGIDPYYFTLHVTIDNAATGHAHKAAQAVADIAAQQDNPAEFYRRVRDGYRLNDLGMSTTSVIADFDPERALIAALQKKAAVGRNMHSDYCRFAGKTVNEWLDNPEDAGRFLLELENAGWIKRGSDPEESRFWRLISGAGAEMFGVFSPRELQLLRDWITRADGNSRGMTFRAAARVRATREAAANGRTGMRLVGADTSATGSVAISNPATLIEALSPGAHHSAPGLHATRKFSSVLRG